MATENPAISYSPPPAWLIRLVNPVTRALLRSPLHGLLGAGLAVLSLRGRKTGTEYVFPVSWHELNDEVYLLTGERWRRNLDEPAEVELTHRGRRVKKRAEQLTNPEAAARAYLRAIERYGLRAARRRMGVVVPDRDRLGFEEVAAACQEGRLAAIRLTDPE